MLVGKHCAPPCGYNDLEIFTSVRCLKSVMAAAAEDQPSVLLRTGFQLYIFYSVVVKGAMKRTLRLERATIPALSVIDEHGHLHHVETK